MTDGIKREGVRVSRGGKESVSVCVKYCWQGRLWHDRGRKSGGRESGRAGRGEAGVNCQLAERNWMWAMSPRERATVGSVGFINPARHPGGWFSADLKPDITHFEAIVHPYNDLLPHRSNGSR